LQWKLQEEVWFAGPPKLKCIHVQRQR
jgi:hypothetical protein